MSVKKPIRWDRLDKGGEYFYGAPPAPSDFYILYLGNECHASFTRNPENDTAWLVLFNGLFYPSPLGTPPGQCKTAHLDGNLTILECKAAVEKLCNAR